MSLREKKITVDKRLRPIRLAFLVTKEDKETLREVFRINTCLWGGLYNLIIPFFKKSPKNWEDRRFKPPSASSIVKGYIDSFDPDYVVVKDKQLLTDSWFDKERLLSFEEVFSIKSDDRISFGVDVSDLYWHLYDKEFKFERRHPIKVFSPKPSKNIALLSACCFGEFPSLKELDYIEKNYLHCFNPKELQIDGKNFLDCFTNEGASPLRITRVELEVRPRGWRAEPAIFFMDATSWLDMVDYWNLRAVGRDVLPLPKQYADCYIELCNRIIKHNFVPYRHNKDMMHETTFICSRSSTKEEMEIFTKKLTSPGGNAISVQPWYPRMWDEWAKDKDHVELCSITAKEESEEIVSENNRLRFKDVTPEFVEKYSGNNSPRWINVVQFKEYSKSYDCPSVLPRNLKGAHRIMRASIIHKVWISSEGINIPCSHYEWTRFCDLPSSFEVFEAWFKEQGFEVELSGAGRILLKIIDSVEGIYGTNIFRNEEIIKKLNDMSHTAVESEVEQSGDQPKSKVRAKTLPIKNWKDLLVKLKSNSGEMAEKCLQELLNYKILKCGINLQCPECMQHTWYALDDLSDRITCERCLEEFDFPVVRPVLESNWHLRTIGPFSIENYAQGGYCSALSLRFFGSFSISNEMTWIPSFSIKHKGTVPIEADFGIFLSQGRLNEIKPPIVIFGECKSFNEFTNKDIKRMEQLADNFPGSVIAFCTLKSSLTGREKKVIARLARKGRKQFKGDQWINPVLILTGIELFGDSAPSCWKEKGEPYNAFADKWKAYDEIQGLCDITQQMHLGIESYWTWYEQKRQKKKQRLKGKIKESPAAMAEINRFLTPH